MINSPWRSDFPALQQEFEGQPYVYLDTAATAQTPIAVIERMKRFYEVEYSSVHRGVHRLSGEATTNMEDSRELVREFISAPSTDNVVFTKGTTEAINLVANTFLPTFAQKGDEIIVTEIEHHANVVPWQIQAERLGLTIKVWPMSDDGQLHIKTLLPLLSDRTKLLAISHISNVLGSMAPLKLAIDLVHKAGGAVLVDGAQAIAHAPVDVQELECDFYAFSGHKLYGPTGIGVLYISPKWLDNLPPWEGGGAMIDNVQLPLGTTFQQSPWRFEAGTPNIAGILGLGEAIRYINSIGFEAIEKHENELMNYAVNRLSEIPKLTIYGDVEQRYGVIPFNLGNHHAFDIGSFLDRCAIAVRTGHHCAIPLIQRLGESAVCRASFGLYSTSKDVDIFVDRLKHIQKLLG